MSYWLLLLTAVIAAGLTAAGMPGLIRYFRAKKEGQQIREEGPTWHQRKSGTPTMGGLLFVLATLVTVVGMGTLTNQMTITTWTLIVVWILYALIGMWDDSIKLFRHQNEGFTPKQKLMCQIVAAVIFAILALPKLGLTWNWLGCLAGLGMIFWLVGFSNAVNLTDGLDGLVTGLATVSFAGYLVIAVHQQQFDVAVFCAALIGSLIGFFPYNHKPAKIFMGDMGSLALGGVLAAVAILVHHPLSLLLLGLVYVLETASVMLQVFWFRRTGKRIFKMTPIHHAFEMDGWSEWQIDRRFWLFQLVIALVTIIVMGWY